MRNVVDGLMAPLVDGVSFGVVGRCKDLADAKGRQQLGPKGAGEFTAMVGEDASGRAKIWYDVLKECFADGTGGVVLRGHEDGVFGGTDHEDDYELHPFVRRQWSHYIGR